MGKKWRHFERQSRLYIQWLLFFKGK